MCAWNACNVADGHLAYNLPIKMCAWNVASACVQTSYQSKCAHVANVRVVIVVNKLPIKVCTWNACNVADGHVEYSLSIKVWAWNVASARVVKELSIKM